MLQPAPQLQPTPPGFTRTPPGAIDAQMFTEEEKPPHVSFDVNDMNAPSTNLLRTEEKGSDADQVSFDAPYDESIFDTRQAEFLSRSDTRLV